VKQLPGNYRESRVSREPIGSRLADLVPDPNHTQTDTGGEEEITSLDGKVSGSPLGLQLPI